MSDWERGCVWVNGQFNLPHEATVSALDVGFLLGDGLFESLRASRGVPYLLDRHLERLITGASALGFAALPDVMELDDTVNEALRRSGLEDAYIRITVTRGLGGRGLDVLDPSPTTAIAVLPLPPLPTPDAGVAAVSMPWEGGAWQIKSTSFQHAVLARRRVVEAGGNEGIYVTRAGRVLEGVTSSVFAVKGGTLITPPLTDCLPGITRGRILELAADAGLPTRETALDVAALMHADELFITNAIQGPRLVTSFDGRPIGGSGVTNGFGALRELYDRDRLGAPAGAA